MKTKTKIIIIEENFCTYVQMKNMLIKDLDVIPSGYRIDAPKWMATYVKTYQPELLVYGLSGKPEDLLNSFKKHGLNKENAEVVMFYAQGFNEKEVKEVKQFFISLKAVTKGLRLAIAA